MSKTSNSLLAFILGTGVGATMGILFAPDSGGNTRGKLTYQLSRYKDDLEDLVKDLVDGKNMPLNEARSEGNKVITDAKKQSGKFIERCQ
jgi:gas vesicle protein